VVARPLETRADANAIQHRGFTPSSGAAEHGADLQLATLPARGPDLKPPTDDGQDATEIATRARHIKAWGRLRALSS
jgi:hypothetical protein